MSLDDNDTGVNDPGLAKLEKAIKIEPVTAKRMSSSKLISPYEIRYLTLSINKNSGSAIS